MGWGDVHSTWTTSLHYRDHYSIMSDHSWEITDAGEDCTLLGGSDEELLEVSIYTNQNSGTIYIQGYNPPFSGVVYDVLGKEVIKKSISNSLDISYLENGIYVLKLFDGSRVLSHKFIKY